MLGVSELVDDSLLMRLMCNDHQTMLALALAVI